MSKKKLLISAFVAMAALSVGSAAFASSGNPDIYVGGALGYGDTHWGNFNPIFNNTLFQNATSNIGLPAVSISDTGFGATAYAGYDFNQYLAVQAGYVYFPNAEFKVQGFPNVDVKTYGLDLLGKVMVPVAGNLGLFAEAGPGYLHSSVSVPATIAGVIGVTGTASTSNVDLVYGFGADYAITPNLVADVSFTRFSGHSEFDTDYQPDADLYAAGLAYHFNVG